MNKRANVLCKFRYTRKMYNALLAAGADPNICDTEGKTALDYAVEARDVELTRALIKHGALFGWALEDDHKNDNIMQ